MHMKVTMIASAGLEVPLACRGHEECGSASGRFDDGRGAIQGA